MNKQILIWLVIVSVILSSVSAISDEDAENNTAVSDASAALNELKDLGIKTEKIQSYFDQLKTAVDKKEHSEARKLQYQISTEKNNAIRSYDKTKIVEDMIINGEQRWLDMRNTKNLLILAKSAFDRQDFTTSLDRASQAETVAQVELKSINWLYVLYYYWWLIILVSFLVIVTTRTVYEKIRTANVTQRINNLVSEEINIISLIKNTYDGHFNKKELSNAQFHKALYEYNHRLVKIRREIANLRAERIRIYSVKKELEFLQKEENNIYDLIKKSQEDHFVKQIVSESEYHLFMDEFNERLAEIEESMTKLQYLQTQDIVLRRIHEKRKPVKNDLLSKTMENIMLPEEKLIKHRKYIELKKAYEKEKQIDSDKHKEKDQKELTEKNNVSEIIHKTYESKSERLKELKDAYENGEEK